MDECFHWHVEQSECYLDTSCDFHPQMFLWCPRWCRHPTAAVWRSVLTGSLWTWTGPSTNITTSARTPAPCWTPTSERRLNLPKPIHKQFIETRGWWENVFNWNMSQCGLSPRSPLPLHPLPPRPYPVMTLLPRSSGRDFHSSLSVMTQQVSSSASE